MFCSVPNLQENVSNNLRKIFYFRYIIPIIIITIIVQAINLIVC